MRDACIAFLPQIEPSRVRQLLWKLFSYAHSRFQAVSKWCHQSLNMLTC